MGKKTGWVAKLGAVAFVAVSGILWSYRSTVQPDSQPARDDKPSPPPAKVTEFTPSAFSGACRGCNVVLIAVDTLRADHVGCLGYSRDTTPHLDRFAASAALFEQAITQGTSSYLSYASIFTSQYPAVHRITPRGRLDERAITLAESMKAAGYQTAAFVDGRDLLKSHGFTQGFDIYEDERASGFKDIFELARAWLDQHEAQPFLLFVQAYDVHDPYHSEHEHTFDPDYDGVLSDHTRVKFALRPATTTESFVTLHGVRQTSYQKPEIEIDGVRSLLNSRDTEHVVAHYDGGILDADILVGEFLENLQQRELTENTVIIVFSDHGESIGEFIGRAGFKNMDFAGHGTMHEEVTRVFLAVRVPGMAPVRVSSQVELIDLLPTILDTVAVIPEPAARSSIQGVSLLPLVSGARDKLKTYAYGQVWAAPSPRFLRTTEWAFLDTGAIDKRLFDLRNDPLEQHNVLRSHPDLERSFKSELQRWDLRNSSLRTRAYIDQAPQERSPGAGPK